MEVKGIIKLIRKTQAVTDTFKKRELVVTTEEQYPQDILLEFTQDKTETLNQYKVGDKVIIGINLRGREWTSPQGEVKYFNTVQGWKTESVETSSKVPPAQPMPSDDQEDDNPF